LHPPRRVRKVHPARREKRDLPGQLVQRARRARKVRKDQLVHKAPSASAGLLVLPDRQDQSDRKVRRARLADKALLDPAASAARPERRAPLVLQGRRAQQVRRVIPARRQQFALSPARTPFAVRTTRCWPVWFVRVARPTERNAQPPARRQPACVSVGNVKPNLGALACSLRQRSRFRKIGLYLLPSPAFREVSHRGLARYCVTMYYKASHLKGERSNGKPSDGNP
jgi:hypothetical protein